MSDKPYLYPMDSRFIISMMPADLRNEIYEILAQNPDHEEALWWNQRSDEDFERLAHSMMNNDYLWNVWRETLYDAIREVKQHIEIYYRTGDIESKEDSE